MAWKAIHRYAPIAPRKARLIVDLVRGRDCDEALNILRFMPQRAGVFVAKVLRSAVANADEQEANIANLYVREAKVDEGPTRHTWRRKDRGRMHPIKKRTSHITLVVEEGK